MHAPVVLAAPSHHTAPTARPALQGFAERSSPTSSAHGLTPAPAADDRHAYRPRTMRKAEGGRPNAQAHTRTPTPKRKVRASVTCARIRVHHACPHEKHPNKNIVSRYIPIRVLALPWHKLLAHETLRRQQRTKLSQATASSACRNRNGRQGSKLLSLCKAPVRDSRKH